MAVSQGSDHGTPDVLKRFRAVVGYGHLRGPVRGYLYYWYSGRQSEIDAISGALWPWVGTEKRGQFRSAATAVERPVPLDRNETRAYAWAAGFFEGEGTIRSRGRYIELALPQSTTDGCVPRSLLRFHETVGHLGWIAGPNVPTNPWSKLPQFVWGSARFEHVQAVIVMLWPWLSRRRKNEAARALKSVAVARLDTGRPHPSGVAAPRL